MQLCDNAPMTIWLFDNFSMWLFGLCDNLTIWLFVTVTWFMLLWQFEFADATMTIWLFVYLTICQCNYLAYVTIW